MKINFTKKEQDELAENGLDNVRIEPKTGVHWMPAALITGSNRGLGLEWVRKCVERGWPVIATCRYPDSAAELQELASRQPEVSVYRLDVTAPDQIADLVQELQGQPIDLLVNNAGVYFEHWGKDPIGSINFDNWEKTFRVNTLGAMRVTEALLPNLSRSSRALVVAISSNMGSIAGINAPRDYAYRSSKVALNAAMCGLAHELEPRGIGVLTLHPGWVRTRMGGTSAPISPEESIRGMLSLVDRFEPSMSGKFFRFDGTPMPW
jgi:NAD(P)-dependent dehydrogenase (short-subunit alcohol dehydrogenase family)